MFAVFLVGLLAGSQYINAQVDIMPQEAVKRIGDDLLVLCNVAYPINSCRFTIGEKTYITLPDGEDNDITYQGRGLAYGECGVHLKNIKEEWNGKITCNVPPRVGNEEEKRSMNLIVAKSPLAPELRVDRRTYRENEIIKLQCISANGRPVSNLSWYIDDQPIKFGVQRPLLIEPLSSDLKTVTQNVTRKVTSEDDGKSIICEVAHPALDKKLQASAQLRVLYSPKRQDVGGIITIFGLKIGSAGRLNVTVRANPRPDAVWTVGDMSLKPGETNDGLGIAALLPMNLGAGFYNFSLLIMELAKHHVGQTYHLKLENDMGHEEYQIILSTLDEPADKELGAGAIAGIVVGILALLIAIFLVVFAKATERWCFAAGGRRKDAKASGESTPTGDVLIESGQPHTTKTSDTESAVGGKTERSRLAELGARMRAVLPRSKDKIQATETTTAGEDDDKPLEDKLVYAELAHSAPAAHPKPPPPASEYAEIVYTDKPADAQTDKKE